jgi:hypothetical protein
MTPVSDDAAYYELASYSLTRRDRHFMHQHVVDAHAVQTATEADKPIRVAQALVGLYLHVEHGLSGLDVQRVHKVLADRRPTWPAFALPEERGSLRSQDVLIEPPGERRDRAIERWARSVWHSCRRLRPDIEAFLSANDITPPRRDDP